MPYIDLADQLEAFLASRKRKGRPSFGTRDPALERPLREAVRLDVEGKARSGRAALMMVLGTDDPSFEAHYRRWNRMKSALRRAAKRAKEIEDNDPWRRKIESFDPDLLKDAEIGTHAFINQNSKDWGKAGRAGWSSVEGYGHGETLIRRDLRGLLAPGSHEMAAYLELCAAEFAQIGLIEIDADQGNDAPPLGLW
jgi:hypothetical protein